MVLPITSLGLQHAAPSERISSGVPRLDAMLAGKGITAAARSWCPAPPDRQEQPGRRVRAGRLPARRARPLFCIRGIRRSDHAQHALYRIDLAPWARKDLLRFHPARPNLCAWRPTS